MKGERIELNVESREPGKGFSRRARRERKIPAIVYGSNKKPASIFIDEGSVVRYNNRNYENALFNLKSKDSAVDNTIVLVKDIDVHPLTRRPLHVDFFALDLKKAVRVSVEIKLEGKPAGLAEGGLLNQVNHKVEIECLPTEIPESIVLDVSALGLGESMHVSDLQMPAGAELITSGDITVCVVNEAEEEMAAVPAATAATATDAAAAPAAGGAAAPAADAKAAAKAPEKK